jgi:exopolyphosphatase/guanosine-5'-triphosphate,3'-diphosphate pyrophosphatase
MVDDVKARIEAFPHAEPMRELFESGGAHMIGTSGAITSLAGLHLGLPRYDRNVVDGLWMDRTTARRRRSPAGPDRRRAGPGAVHRRRSRRPGAGRRGHLQAVQELWPCSRVRVADRGLREGLLMSLMSEQQKRAGVGAASGGSSKPPVNRMSDEEPPRKRMVKPPTGGTDAAAPSRRA